jgi:hypothetical protein
MSIVHVQGSRPDAPTLSRRAFAGSGLAVGALALAATTATPADAAATPWSITVTRGDVSVDLGLEALGRFPTVSTVVRRAAGGTVRYEGVALADILAAAGATGGAVRVRATSGARSGGGTTSRTLATQDVADRRTMVVTVVGGRRRTAADGPACLHTGDREDPVTAGLRSLQVLG